MATALRPIGHEDRLSLVDHLSELRKRIVISLATLVASFALCFWQNDAILDIVTKPVRTTQNLDAPSKNSKDPLEQSARYNRELAQALRAAAPALAATGSTLGSLGEADNLSATQRRGLDRASLSLARASRQVAQAAAALPRNQQRNLVTLGVTEPFTATITIAFYAALLLAMPLLLYQAYAFVLPAFSPHEKKVALPLMLMVPVLFITGVAFGYFVVLDRAVAFLQNFNDDSFDILLQAKDYFRFAVLFVAGIGLLFQIPVGVLAITRLGVLTPKQIADNRGYVILGIAIVAAVATPTPDPVTMSIAMVPLIVLFELSILLARWLDRVKPPPVVEAVDDADVDEDGDDADDDEDDDDDPDERDPDDDPDERDPDDDPDERDPDDDADERDPDDDADERDPDDDAGERDPDERDPGDDRPSRLPSSDRDLDPED